MTTGDTLSATEFRNGLIVASERIRGARDELCALDAAAGDGDLGATLHLGFGEVLGVLEQFDSNDLGDLLVQVGTKLARAAPSTIGALLGTAYMRAGKAIEGFVELHPADLVAVLSAAAAGVAERGRSTVGQRTVLDSMAEAASAARVALESGGDVSETLRAAAWGARAGAEATAKMEPQLGRAGWIADRARGNPDAGAVAWALFVEGLAEGVAALTASPRRISRSAPS